MIKFENATNGRYYYLEVNEDMLNALVLRIVYGGRRISRTRVILCDTKDAISLEIDRLSKRRLKRGYSLVTS